MTSTGSGSFPTSATPPRFRAGAFPQRQSDNTARYEAALDRLDHAGLVYACDCSRRDIAQEVPDVFGEEMRYPGRCRARAVDRSHREGASCHHVAWCRRVR